MKIIDEKNITIAEHIVVENAIETASDDKLFEDKVKFFEKIVTL